MDMNFHESNQKLRTHSMTMVAAFFLVFLISETLAQNALDGSLQIGSGGANSANASSARPVRRDTSQTRSRSQTLGLNPYDDFIRIVSQETGSRPSLGQVQPINQNNALPPARDTNSWKSRDPLRFDSQGLALSTNLSKSMDSTDTPYAAFRTRQGDTGNLTTNNLRGIRLEIDRDRLGSARMSLYETARLREDVRKNAMQSSAIGVGLQDPFQSSDALRLDLANPSKPRSLNQGAEPMDNRISGYGMVMKEVKARFQAGFERGGKPTNSADKQGENKLDEKASRERMLDAYGQLKRDLSATDNLSITDMPPKNVDKGAVAVDPETEKRDGIHMTLDEYALVLKHGQHIDSMTTDQQNRFDELLSEGQRAMYEGNAFVAEKRFQVALLIQPNDPLAMAGMLHCQISANLAASAALTLHKLFMEHPEMMDVTWGPRTIPPRPRLEKALIEVGRRIEIGRDTAQFGLLQAYIGHLLQNQAAVKSGLSVMRGTPGDESMAVILKKLWIEPAADSAAQKTQEPAQAKDSATPPK